MRVVLRFLRGLVPGLTLLLPVTAQGETGGRDAELPPVLAFVHVSVIPMDREVVLADQTVVVAGDRIAALGPSATVPVPDGAKAIDGTGSYLMPGLADMHVHVWDEQDLLLFVANGVTAVRNMFGNPLFLERRQRAGAGELLAPRIVSAGPIIDGDPPVWPGSTTLSDPSQAEAIVVAQKEAGYDFLKPYARLSPECYDALVVAGERHGMALMGHVPEALDLADVLLARQRTIEHLGGWAEAAQAQGSPLAGQVDFTTEDDAWMHVDPARLASIAAEMREAGVWNCPTLVVFQKWVQGNEAKALFERGEMRYASSVFRAMSAPESPWNYLSRMPAERAQAARRSVEPRKRAVAALRAAGAGILAGTDTGNPYVLPGFALHEELANLVDAGLSPFEALRAATANGAECMQADWGVVAQGRTADLLLLGANPLEDVRNAAKRKGVVLGGRWFAEEELRAELEKRAEVGIETEAGK